jgi:GT2 family glycosyltransferase
LVKFLENKQSTRMKLSIIIVSYNTKELLEQCLESIISSMGYGGIENNKEKNQTLNHYNTKPLSYEIIIVDNNSTDGTQEYLGKLKTHPPKLTTRLPGTIRTRLVERDRRVAEGKSPKLKVKNSKKQTSPKLQIPNLKVILNKENAGFAKANNQGIEKSEGEYVLLLNSDTIITEKNFFNKIIKFLEKNNNIGILGPKLLWENGQIQSSGGYFPTLPRLITWALMLDDLPLINKIIKPYHPHQPNFYTNDSYYQKLHHQDWVTGACFFIKRIVLDKIGFLDEKFFMYAEEMEYCYRAKKAGFGVIYYPKASLIHLGGKSGTSLLAAKGEFWGIKYFYQKHQPSWQKPIAGLLLKTAAFLRSLVFYQNQEKRQVYQQVLADL